MDSRRWSANSPRSSSTSSQKRLSTSSQGGRSCVWLRSQQQPDEIYALGAPDSPVFSPQAPGLPNERGDRNLVRTRSAPQLQRWWLRNDSLSDGFYQVTSGLVQMHSEPNAEAPVRGILRGGARFHGTPCRLGGSVWIMLKPRTTPFLATNLTSEKMNQLEAHRLSLTSPASDARLPEEGGIWVQDNKQYIARLRDMGREGGVRSYGSSYGFPRSKITRAWVGV